MTKTRGPVTTTDTSGLRLTAPNSQNVTKRADHDELAVRDVENTRHPVLQAQPHGDKGEDASEQQTSDDDVPDCDHP